LTGVAVKVTLVPEQIELELAEMLTLAETGWLTYIVRALEVVVVGHALLEVTAQVITLLLVSALLEYW
jgi:hypothetical protein